MSDPGKAVFLSYASQDAEAAKRIADALRTAGVEVWFDQSELVGGDAWDAKIRKQIKECALLIPIISANTQQRTEGYFRLEWRLADQRTHLMAKGRAFLLPVVIDDTRDAGAHVPDSFTEVQWTRLPGGETTPAFVARMKKLLEGEVIGQGSEVGGRRTYDPEPMANNQRLRRWWWALPIFGVALALLLVMKEGHKDKSPAPTAASAVSEARKLVAQARALYEDGDDANHETLSLAEDLLNKAQALDPADAEVWAAQAHVSRTMGLTGYEISAARRALLQKQAERAIQLDPDSINAKVAYAMFLTDAGGNSALEGARQLRALEATHPGNHDLLQAMAIAYSVGGNLEESSAAFDRANALPGGDARALAQKGAQLVWYGRYAEATTALDGSLAIRGTGRAHVFRTMLQLCWQGDLDGAATSLEKWPAWLLLEPRGATIASQVWLWRHEPDKAVAVLNAVPRDSWNDIFFTGPKAVLLALAHEMAGRSEAAHAGWENTVKVADRMLAEDPLSPEALAYKACALARLGDKAAAETTLRALEQSGGLRAQFWSCAPSSALLRLAAGRGDDIAAKFDTELRVPRVKATFPSPQAALRLNPVFDSIRATPSFQKWLTTAPTPKPAAVAEGDTAFAKASVDWSGQAARPDQKSVAVLAFADLSEKHDSEYFSDGISEELLNVLAKVPGLKVTARTSSFRFKGKDTSIPEIAHQLGVAYVIEGSVRKAGDKVRITAQLIKAADDFHVWSDTFTRDLKDVFAVQDEIAGLIAQQLSLKLGTVSAASAVNPEAYELYLQARAAWNRRDDTSLAHAADLLDHALAIAPDFARAHAARADVWSLQAQNQGSLGDFSQRDSPEMQRVFAEARRALDLEPESAEAHTSLGNAYLLTWRQSDAIREFRRAIELNPSYVTAHHWLGRALWLEGWIDEAGAELRRAAELDPLSARILDNNAAYEYAVGHYLAALALNERALTVQPDAMQAACFMVRDLSALGRHDEAVALLRRFGLDRRSNTAIFAVEAFVCAGRTPEAEEAFSRIKVGDGRFWGLMVLGHREEALVTLASEDFGLGDGSELLLSPLFDSIRDDPRFQQRLAFFGLTEAYARAQAWRAAHPPEKTEVKL